MESMRKLLLESASRLFEDAAEPEIQESVEQGRFPERLWQEIDDNGLPSALLSEEQGGAGLGLADGLAILRLAGAFALPLPLLETLLGRYLLAQAGLEIPEGPLALGLGAPEPLRAEVAGDGVAVTGIARLPWPGVIEQAVAVASGTQGPVVALLPLPETEPWPNTAGEPRATVSWEGLRVSAGAFASSRLAPLDALRLAAAGRAQMLAGAMERILDSTLEHAQGRVQFGRPIARFQAVQHLVARMAGEVAAVGVAADAAAAALERGAGELAAAAAKARAGEAAASVARIAHQVHGALGFTREHSLHRFTRRLWAWRDDDGDEGFWQGQVGVLAARSGGQELWKLLCGS